jgi:PAS domain S-box-containing protein
MRELKSTVHDFYATVYLTLGPPMSSDHLLWIGYSAEMAETREALEAQLELTVDVISGGREALNLLAENPGRHLIVIIDERWAGLDLAPLTTGIKQINPAIEIIVFGNPVLAWANLTLPRYYRPILLDPRCGPDILISCVAKLQEIVEAKEDYEQLSRGIGDNIGMSRTSTEAILALLSRQNSIGMFSMRRDGFFTSYNSEAERLTGYSMEEVAHIQMWTHAVLIDQEILRTFLDSISVFWAKKIGRDNMRLKIKRKDGRILTISMTAIVLLDNFGQARQITAFFFDPLEFGSIREYELLCESEAFAVYKYLPARGFIRISTAALNLLNRAFSCKLTSNEVLGKKIEELPLPRETASLWHEFLCETASNNTSDGTSIPPIGLPGRHILQHIFVNRVPTGTKEQWGVLAAVAPREDLRSDALQNHSPIMFAEKILNEIPRPFVLLQAVRDGDGHIHDFKCMNMNLACLKLLGFEDEFRAGILLTRVLREAKTAKLLIDHARQVTETGQSRDFEVRITLKLKKVEQKLIRFWFGKMGDGVALFFHDVTAKREEETHLKQYRHVFSHMEEAIIVTDLDGNIIDWNPASERMFGYAKERILGKSAYILTQKADGLQLRQQSRDILRDGDVWKGEYEFVREDGSRGVAFSVFAMLKDDQGKIYGTVGLCHDLTERKRLEERLTAKGQELQEKNFALNTLLRHAETERLMACERIATDLSRKITDRLFQILQNKNKAHTVETQAKLLLQELKIAPEVIEIDKSDPGLRLTEKEREVAQLIRLGKTTQEIAFILDKSPDTIRLQRISIRKKLGISQRDRNLSAYLKKTDLS